MKRRPTLLGALSFTPLALGAACPANAGDRTRTSRKLLSDFLEALIAHEMEKFKMLCIADGYIQDQALAINAASLAGREAVVTQFGRHIEAFPDLTVKSDVSVNPSDRNHINARTRPIRSSF